MSDTLTASFCERCGTRHEFRAPTGLNPLRKTRGFIGGLRNYLVSDAALSDAMREGMQTQESVVAAAQLDAFHESVHLCIGCRQYTCHDCWNADAGRCRTCAPLAGVDDLATRIAAALDGSAVVPVFEHPTATPLPAESWPQADSEVYPTPVAKADPGYSLAVVPPEPTFGEQPVELTDEERFAAEVEEAAPEPELEPVAAEVEEAAPEPELEPVDAEVEEAAPEPEPEPVAAEVEEAAPEPEAVERPPLRVVAWDEDAPVTEPELPQAASAEPALEPVVPEAEPVEERQAAELEPAVEFEPTPAALPVASEPEPVVAEPEPPQPPEVRPSPLAPRRGGPMRDRVVRLPTQPPARPRRERRIAAAVESDEMAARRAQLEELGLDVPSDAIVEPDASQVVPYRSRGAPVSNRDATAAAIREGALLWEASAREVGAAGVTVQSCGSCGLALSASARFCRRCGERQAQSA